ncbi:MAG: hypothetical protein ACP5OZ_02775 [Candidatus Woesearchaeota archaeon]
MPENYESKEIEKIANNPELLRKELLSADRMISELSCLENKDFKLDSFMRKNINDFLFRLNNILKSEILENLIYRGINLEIYLLGLVKSSDEHYVNDRISEIASKIDELDNAERNKEIKNKIELLKNIRGVEQGLKQENNKKENCEAIYAKNEIDSLRLTLCEISRYSSLCTKLFPYISELKNQDNVKEIFENCTKLGENSNLLLKLYEQFQSEVVELTLCSNLKTEFEYLKMTSSYNPDYFKERTSKLKSKLESMLFFDSEKKENLLNELRVFSESEKVSKEKELEKSFKTIDAYYSIFKTTTNLPNWMLKICFKNVKEALDFIYLETRVEELLKRNDENPKLKYENKDQNVLDKKKLNFASKGTKLLLEIIDETIKRDKQQKDNPNIFGIKKTYENFLKFFEQLKD